jgi:hypothetical protein
VTQIGYPSIANCCCSLGHRQKISAEPSVHSQNVALHTRCITSHVVERSSKERLPQDQFPPNLPNIKAFKSRYTFRCHLISRKCRRRGNGLSGLDAYFCWGHGVINLSKKCCSVAAEWTPKLQILLSQRWVGIAAAAARAAFSSWRSNICGKAGFELIELV